MPDRADPDPLSETWGQTPAPLPRAEHSCRKTSRAASTSDFVL